MSDFERVWSQIEVLAGETFHTKTGKPFAYDCSRSVIHLRNTNRALPRSDFAKAMSRFPLPGPAALQDLQGPSYIYAILTDPRVFTAARTTGQRVSQSGRLESSTPISEDAVDALRKRHAAAFEAAWQDLGVNCAETVAPEATYQAWLAHFLIQRLGVLHVVREVDFGAKYLGEQAAVLFGGSSLMVDILVLRQPVVQLPRRAALADETLPGGEPNPRSGLKRLGDFSVITELKVHSTQAEGLAQAQVVRDFLKLSARHCCIKRSRRLGAGRFPVQDQIRHRSRPMPRSRGDT